MRNEGERSRGGPDPRSRRGDAPAHGSPGRAGANGGAALFTPAYRVSHAAADPDQPEPAQPGYGWAHQAEAGDAGYPPYSAGDLDPSWTDADRPGLPWADDAQEASWAEVAAGYGATPAPKASNAVRGFPPAPNDPLPVYPPGPFAAWNQREADAARGGLAGTRPGDHSRQLAAASITPVEFDTDFSLPAIKDPIPGRARTAGTGTLARPRPAAAVGTDRPSTPGTARRGADRGGPASRGSRSGRGSRAAARPARGARRQPVTLAIGTAVVIIAAVALILFLTSPGHGGSPSSNGTPPPRNPPSASPTPSRPHGSWGFIGLRSTDAMPVTATELFPGTFTGEAITANRAAAARGFHCRAALIGSALQLAVRKAGCTQVVRATYVARGVKMMATIGVFNLRSTATASTAALAAGRTEFVAPLHSKKGPAHRIGQGTGIEEAVVEGHYLLLGWAEYTGLSAPRKNAQRLQLDNFMTTLIRNTVGVALSYRMINGKPMPAG